MSHGRSTASSILQILTLNPLPYPVLLILLIVLIFLGSHWFSSYEEAVESTGDSLNLVLMATPVILIFAVRWLSSIENPESFFWFGWDRQRRATHYVEAEGASPWGVAALILVVLVLLMFQSTVLEALFG